MKRPSLLRPFAQPVSIVMTTLNHERAISPVLASIAAGSRPLDLIVVDGHSDDATCDVVDRFSRTAPTHIAVRLLTSPVRNTAAQRNRGALKARHELLLFLDPNVPIGAQQVDVLVEGFGANPCAVASCLVHTRAPDLREKFIHALGSAVQRLTGRQRRPSSAACILTTRHVFHHCGGFDPRLQDPDANFCRKAASLGPFRMLTVSVQARNRSGTV